MDKSNKSRDEGAELTKQTLIWAREHVTGDQCQVQKKKH